MYFSTLLAVLALGTVKGMLRHPLVDRVYREQTSPLVEKVRYSNDWAVEVSGGLSAANQLAARHGFVNLGQVGRVEQQRLKTHSKREYRHPQDPKFSREWSLINAGQVGSPPGLDINVEKAWMQGYTGAGVVVGFVDDGLEHSHPDLVDNYDSSASYDFANYDRDPTPSKYSGDEPDRHGTSCAGEVGMSKDNSNCGVGVAYESKIGGLKMDLGDSDDLTESDALGYVSNHIHVYSNSWGPSDYGFIVDGPGHYLAHTFRLGAEQGRNGLGSIFVWAAGNGGKYHDSCTADGYASSIYTIAVGSADQTGKQADYDEFCSSKMAVTYSYNSKTFPSADDDWKAYNQITTTTLNGQCTDDFTGTSASTPLMSGVAALTLQANPLLTWRDMQYLIVYTSDTRGLVNGDWQTNGAGLKVSHKFGFGAINAEAMVTRAKRWTTVPPQVTRVVLSPSTSNYETIRSTWSTTFDVQSSIYQDRITFLEHVVVNMTLTLRGYNRGYDESDFETEINYVSDVDELYRWLEDPHPRRGDIKIELTSPQGTVSTLLPYRNYDFVNEEGYSDWPFMSVQHWGENPVGRWKLNVTYRSSSGYVRASGIRMTLHGTASVPSSVLAIPSSCHSDCLSGCSGPTSSSCDTCKKFRVASTLECVSKCPNTTYAHNKYCLSGPRQPDHDAIYKIGIRSSKPSSAVFIVSGIVGFVLLLVIVGVVVGVAIKYRMSRTSTARGFHYSPVAPAAV